ncbi:hypothetical protein ABIA38_008511 [Embleya sp. AB8]
MTFRHNHADGYYWLPPQIAPFGKSASRAALPSVLHAGIKELRCSRTDPRQRRTGRRSTATPATGRHAGPRLVLRRPGHRHQRRPTFAASTTTAASSSHHSRPTSTQPMPPGTKCRRPHHQTPNQVAVRRGATTSPTSALPEPGSPESKIPRTLPTYRRALTGIGHSESLSHSHACSRSTCAVHQPIHSVFPADPIDTGKHSTESNVSSTFHTNCRDCLTIAQGPQGDDDMPEQEIADTPINRAFSPEYFRTDPTSGPPRSSIIPPAVPSHSTLSEPSGKFAVRVDQLAPAASKAVSVAMELRSLGADINHGPPPGTPGFMTGFQLGELSREWGGAIAHLSDRAQTAADKIYRTRTKYMNTESNVATEFTPGS